MTDRTPRDQVETAGSFIARADRFAADARLDQVSVDGKFVLAYQCALDLLNATLALADPQASRRRWTHAKRIEACSTALPESAHLFSSIDRSRQARNLVVYSGQGTEEGVLVRLLADVAELRAVVASLTATA